MVLAAQEHKAMRMWMAAALIFALGAGGAAAQERSGGLAGFIKSLGRPQGALTQRDAAAGLKEALQLSAVAVTTRLGRTDGFFADPKVKIPLPGMLGRAQRTLAPMGMAGPLDDLERRVNRGAEAAMPQAKTLFVNAIKGMTVTDAIGIVRGGDTAGTQYLRDKSQAQLTGLLRPYMETALTDAGAFTALDTAASRAGFASAATNLRSELVTFAVGKALDGAFGYIAEEERAIRRDPARRTTDLLRKVFGG
jgi:hypothetical protein